VLVATTRPLDPAEPSVRTVSGPAAEMIAEARAVAGDRDVYVDGGRLIQQLLDAGLIDELIVTVIPVDLGEGIPLLAGEEQWERVSLEASRAFPSGVEQQRYVRAN
jgi:dihydrofolate reductase